MKLFRNVIANCILLKIQVERIRCTEKKWNWTLERSRIKIAAQGENIFHFLFKIRCIPPAYYHPQLLNEMNIIMAGLTLKGYLKSFFFYSTYVDRAMLYTTLLILNYSGVTDCCRFLTNINNINILSINIQFRGY